MENQSTTTSHTMMMTGGESASAAPAALGQGYGSVSGMGLSTAVEIESHEPVGASTTITGTVTESFTELASALGVTQSLAVQYGLGNVSTKVKWLSGLNVSEHTVSVVVAVRRNIDGGDITNVRMKTDLSPPPDRDANNFVLVYGDSYVNQIVRGGEFYGVFNFYAQTSEQRREVVALLKANYIGISTKIDEKFQVNIDNVLREVRTTYSFDHYISGVKSPTFESFSKVVEYALSFTKVPLDSPVVNSFKSIGYEHAKGFPAEAFANVVRNRESLIGDSVNDGGLTGKAEGINCLLNQIRDIKNTYDFYSVKVDDHKLDQCEIIAKNDIDKIKEAMVGFNRSPNTIITIPQLLSPSYGIPILRYKIHQSEFWGGGGGDPFDIPDQSAFIARHDRVTSLNFWASWKIEAIRVNYLVSGSFTYGNPAGRESPTMNFAENQFIAQFGGRSGNRVDYLNVTNTGGNYIADGGDGGNPFEWRNTNKAEVVLGLAGRAGKDPDAVRVVFAEFDLAAWRVKEVPV